jgi:hypothetical protein
MPFIATIDYVRSLKIGHLTVWCYGPSVDGPAITSPAGARGSERSRLGA